VIIRGAANSWAAKETWKFKNFYDKFKDARLKVGLDDDGNKIKVHFKEFVQYLLYNRDDSPLYLFESGIENNKKAKSLIEDYEVPKFFKKNLF
jgi:histone arginine demethylase JMJD6